MRRALQLLREAAEAFVDVLSPGATIAFYSVTALLPVVIIVIWITGLVSGDVAARDAVAWHFHSLMGEGGAKLFLTTLDTAARQSSLGIA